MAVSNLSVLLISATNSVSGKLVGSPGGKNDMDRDGTISGYFVLYEKVIEEPCMRGRGQYRMRGGDSL